MSNQEIPWVETWKGIAGMCRRSERWCRYMARRPQDPLPVYKVGGIVRLDQGDFDRWVGREQQRSMARDRDQPTPVHFELRAI
jgi:hypothetical protein